MRTDNGALNTKLLIWFHLLMHGLCTVSVWKSPRHEATVICSNVYCCEEDYISCPSLPLLVGPCLYSPSICGGV